MSELKQRAVRGDSDAIATMFRQFLPPDEPVQDAAYLGVRGLFGIGEHCFGAVTDRRVAGLRVGILGGVAYNEASFEHINSSFIFNPSRLALYVWQAVFAVLWISLARSADEFVGTRKVVYILVLLLLLSIGPYLLTRVFYRVKKSGSVSVVAHGVSVYIFADRQRLGAAARLHKNQNLLTEVRLGRLDVASLISALTVYAPPDLDASQQQQSPEWRPDPSGRHQLRYWTGSRWSDHVSDDGETARDAIS